MGNSILEPSVIPQVTMEDPVRYLVYTNYLSEFTSEDEKSIARANLGVYGIEETLSREDIVNKINSVMKEILKGYFTTAEIPELVKKVAESFGDKEWVASDGSVPFTNAQSQATLPTKDEHLANKSYVDSQILQHKKEKDPHGILKQVETMLGDYRKAVDSYEKSELFTAKEINERLAKYVLKDGSTPFTKPQIGVDPTTPSHLATMRYVQKTMASHNEEVDPHGLYAFIKKTLSNYYTRSETYTKAQTFSRDQLYGIIKTQMNDVVEAALTKYAAENGNVKQLQETWETLFKQCVKADGSVSHNKPQAGVQAVNGNEFVILSQVDDLIKTAVDALNKTIDKKTHQNTWLTSGPVRTTVGFVEDNTRMPREMTVQQIMDAIFYGRQTGIKAPKYAEYGEQVCLEIFTHGTGMIEAVDIYKNGELIGTLYAEDFMIKDNGYKDVGAYYVFCETGEFTEDTEWKVEFHYSDGEEITDTAFTKLAYPMFIGAIPYWWNVQEDVTIAALRKFAETDPDSCKLITHKGPDISHVKVKFNFEDARQRSIIVVVPYDYPDLLKIITPTQEIEAEAFAKWVQPMYPNNVPVGVNYKIYVFNQSLVKLDQIIKFYFSGQTDEDDE